MDITLDDVLWIGGSVTVFALCCIVFRLSYDHRQTLHAIWRQSRMSGMFRVNIVRDFGNDDMSSEDENRPAPLGFGAGSGDAVPSRQHQAAPELVPDFEAVLEFLAKHKLTDEQAIDVLTRLQRESGHLMSANKIRDTVGGNEAQVKARVARQRPKPPEPPRTMGRAERPANGW